MTLLTPFARSFGRTFSVFAVLAALGSVHPCNAQSTQPEGAPPAHAAAAAARAVPAFMISDVHLDPFHDPGKVKALAAAPISEWRAILSEPASANHEAAFTQLQQTCHARGVDTSYTLLRSSLLAMRAHQPDARFMVISGDLIAHAFTCRYAAVFPNAADGDYQAFVLKTLGFLVRELKANFPGMPIYISLGNNDSGCGDYKLDANGSFLAEAGKIIASALPLAEQASATAQFAAGGYYSVKMAAPMHDTRLVIVNDLFFSPKYATCGDKPDADAVSAQLAWLDAELSKAQQAGEKVWVMGHIPPGIDPYSTVAKFANVCGGAKPTDFLASNKMSETVVNHGAEVKLAIFAHTHMDEMRLLEPEGKDAQPDGTPVAVKMVSSISPVDGNNPSFTIARVNPATAELEDYEVIAASNQTGVATRWNREYDFRESFHEPAFTSATLKKLFAEFESDNGASNDVSKAYIQHYFVGDASRELTPFWPQYTCALDHQTNKSFSACYCATGQ